VKRLLTSMCLVAFPLGLLAGCARSAQEEPSGAVRIVDEGIGWAGGGPAHAERVARLHAVCAWAPVFGGADVRSLHGFDLAVVDGVRQRDGTVDASTADVRLLHRRGMLVLSYLSIGTLERWRHYARPRAYRWTLGPVDGWAGERYVDARKRGWRELMKAEARRLARAGFDGLYLDNVDVAEVYPRTRWGVIRLVRGVRAAVPGLLLVAQNGLVVADRLPLDGIAHEDVWWRWAGRYRASPATETEAILRGLRRQHARGLPVFTLDYAPPGSAAARQVLAKSLAEGFRPAVSVVELDAPPHAILDCPPG
jgi:uncharacterized protein (TIGR01370 family)